MGRAQGHDATTVVGPDGQIYRRGRRRHAGLFADTAAATAAAPLASQTSASRQEIEAFAEQFWGFDTDRVLNMHKLTDDPVEFLNWVAAGETRILGYIRSGHSWKLPLKNATQLESVKLLGEGKVEAELPEDLGGSVFHASGDLDVTLTSGLLRVWDACTVTQSGDISAALCHDRSHVNVEALGCYAELNEDATGRLVKGRRVEARDSAVVTIDSPASGSVSLTGQANAHAGSDVYDVALLKSGHHHSGDPLLLGDVFLFYT